MAKIFMANYAYFRLEPRARRQAVAMADAGHDVYFIAPKSPGGPMNEVVNGVQVQGCNLRQEKPTTKIKYLYEYAIFFLIIFFHLSLRPRKYDMIQICNMPDLLTLGALIPRIFGTPVIHDVHDLMTNIYINKFNVGQNNWVVRICRAQLKLMCKFASHVVVSDPVQEEEVLSLGIPREKVTLLLNLPEERVFAKDRPPSENEDAFTVVYHGSLNHRLGVDIALKAIANVRDEIENIKVRVIGGGEELPSLVALRKELGLEDIVWLSNGYVPLDQIPELIGDADIGLSPLRNIPATQAMLPTKLMEYAFLKIPVVVTETPLIRRFFDDSMVRFVESEDIEDVSNAIMDLYKNPQKRTDYTASCHEKFSQKYIWSEYKKMYLGIVDGLLAKG